MRRFKKDWNFCNNCGSQLQESAKYKYCKKCTEDEDGDYFSIITGEPVEVDRGENENKK